MRCSVTNYFYQKMLMKLLRKYKNMFFKGRRNKDTQLRYKVGFSTLFSALFLPLTCAGTTPLYDFDRFFFEPHPFSKMALLYKTQSLVSAYRPQFISNQPRLVPNAQQRVAYAKPGATKILGATQRPEIKPAFFNHDKSLTEEDFYGAVNIIGSYSSMQNPNITNTGSLKVNNGKDAVFSLGLAVGYEWNNVSGIPIRSEMEYHYRVRMDFDSRDTKNNGTPGYENNLHSHVILVNVYYDWEFTPLLTLYGGGGFGAAQNTSSVDRVNLNSGAKTSRSDKKSGIAWNVGLGALLKIRPLSNWIFDFRYRYIDLGKISSGPHIGNETITAEKYFSHDLVIGAVYEF